MKRGLQRHKDCGRGAPAIPPMNEAGAEVDGSPVSSSSAPSTECTPICKTKVRNVYITL
jgi:hypothetical protein